MAPPQTQHCVSAAPPQQHRGTELRPLKLSPRGRLSRPELELPGAPQEEGQRALCLSPTASASQCPLVPCGSQPTPAVLEAPPAAPGQAPTRSAPVWAAHHIAWPGPSCPLPQPPGPQQPQPRHLESPLCHTPLRFSLPGHGERSPASNPTTGTAVPGARVLVCPISQCAPGPVGQW